MKIKKARVGINRFGVRKYSKVKSETENKIFYDVGKVRVRNTKRYKYVCTCPDNFYRQKTCKHIGKFKRMEVK